MWHFSGLLTTQSTLYCMSTFTHSYTKCKIPAYVFETHTQTYWWKSQWEQFGFHILLRNKIAGDHTSDPLISRWPAKQPQLPNMLIYMYICCNTGLMPCWTFLILFKFMHIYMEFFKWMETWKKGLRCTTEKNLIPLNSLNLLNQDWYMKKAITYKTNVCDESKNHSQEHRQYKTKH